MHQPATTDATTEELRRARNAMREKLWHDDAFAHRWMCHPERDCADGCSDRPDPGKLALYVSEMEA